MASSQVSEDNNTDPVALPLAGEVALVTGSGRGLGHIIARRLMAMGASIVLHDINEEAPARFGEVESLSALANAMSGQSSNVVAVTGDITDTNAIEVFFQEHYIDSVIHLAAESHVDRSITNPIDFVMTNVVGTVVLLNAFKQFGNKETGRFYHVSTDEVYGTLGEEGKFTESTPYDPNSPYSASKAGSDHFVRAYHETYKLPVVISNCSNNYGSHQFPEKLIPLMIHNIKNEKPLPVYGKGENIRDWLWVEDHAAAIDVIFHQGKNGETYNIGGNNEWKNIDLVHKLCEIMDRKLNRPLGSSSKLITYVNDRAGHDYRYAIDASKLEENLGWKPSVAFDQGFEKTIDWYLDNEDWLNQVTSGSYQDYYFKHYDQR
jgi:dTDP-glucose 4,6-dehydratase